MTTLCAWADATGLLPDIEPPRRIFLLVTRDAHFPITPAQAAQCRDRGGDGVMNGKTPEIFHLPSDLGVARLHSGVPDNEFWFY
jgi:hypothetical protein